MAVKFAKMTTDVAEFQKQCSQVELCTLWQQQLLQKALTLLTNKADVFSQLIAPLENSQHHQINNIVNESKCLIAEAQKFKLEMKQLQQLYIKDAEVDQLIQVREKEPKSRKELREEDSGSHIFNDLHSQISNFHTFVAKLLQVQQGDEVKLKTVNGQLLNNILRWVQGLNFSVKQNQFLNGTGEETNTVDIESEDEFGNLPEMTVKRNSQNQSTAPFFELSKVNTKKKGSHVAGEEREERAKTGHCMRSQVGL